MNTVIEIIYNNYTENVIINNENHEEVIYLLTSDKDILDYEVIVKGDVNFTDFCQLLVCEKKRGKNVGLVRRLQNTLTKMERRTYFKTNREAYDHEERISKLESNIQERILKLTNIERLYV